MEYLSQYNVFYKKAKSDIAVAKLILKAEDTDLDIESVYVEKKNISL